MSKLLPILLVVVLSGCGTNSGGNYTLDTPLFYFLMSAIILYFLVSFFINLQNKKKRKEMVKEATSNFLNSDVFVFLFIVGLAIFIFTR